MSTANYDPKMMLDNSGFLAAMGKAREAAAKSIGMMGAIGASIGGMGAKVAGLSAPGDESFSRDINDAMKQGRQFAAQARQAFQSAGVSDKDMGTKKPDPLDHFKTPAADRYAKLGLFIGGAPQTPGISEARRTALATEAIKKGIDKLNVVLAGNNTRANMPVYAE